MKQITRYIMSLVALLALTTGAWAQDTYNVTFKANGNTKVVENITLPYTFSCNYENGLGTDELDLIIQELYGLSEGCCKTVAPNSDNASVTCGLNGENNQYITVNAPFDGTATVTGRYLYANYTGFDYSLEITCAQAADNTIPVTTDAASEQDVFTTASFTMPASNAKVSYELVRDMQDNDNPVEFTGLPDDGKITVAAGDGGKYQPTEALDIQLTDALAEEGSQNIIEADGITVNVLVGAENGQGAIDYDQDNPITLDAFLADMKPGYYWIKAEPKDETSQYYGTVYSKELTVAEAAYSTSVNIEQLVLDNGVKYDITKDFIDSYIEYASINALDTLNDLDNKAMRNEPYLGLKLKTAGAYIKVLVKKGSTLNVKLGAVKEALGVTINGTAQEAIAATDEGTTYSYTAENADAEVVFTTASNKTVVFKQIMIDEPLADITLPEPGAYLITVATPENGTAAVDWANKKYRTPVGAEVTVTATPAEGYELNSISVTGATSNTAYEVSADGKFTMPGEEVTVSATFKEESYVKLSDYAFDVNSEFIDDPDYGKEIEAKLTYKSELTGSYQNEFTLNATFDYEVVDKNGTVVTSGTQSPLSVSSNAVTIYIDGLEEGTEYTIRLTSAKVTDFDVTTFEEKVVFNQVTDLSGTPLASYTFTTSDATGINNVNANGNVNQNAKVIKNGKLIIIKNGKEYSANGSAVE